MGGKQLYLYTSHDLNHELSIDLKFILNKQLPIDIVVHDVQRMLGKPHARFDAISRSYDYFIHKQKEPFLKYISSEYNFQDYDFDKMKKDNTKRLDLLYGIKGAWILPLYKKTPQEYYLY